MDRRPFVGGVALGVVAAPLAVSAQQPPAKVPRIGVVHPGASADVAQFVAAFRQGLLEHGYVEAQTMSWSAASVNQGRSG